LNEYMETSAPMVNDILSNALFQSSSHINQTLHQFFSRPELFTLDWLLKYTPVNWIELRAVRRPQIWKFIGVTTISEIIALYEWRQRRMHKLLQ